MINSEIKNSINVRKVTINDVKDVFELLNVLYKNSINYDSFIKKYKEKILIIRTKTD